ncbi:type II secretion system protein N [Aquisalimonas asiatica]|uniref:Type II secretion system protein N n=1 Tax=Aquisalimonas asiatica TaxID=406100 RepID=A0A1H8VLD6_9GAMM|nr:type II secretion system protein N [Aquisalimonas asiatica]SEP16216.1 Type II secretion system (T2SS), protein N [Aquisalimonas asiatica]
MKRRIALIALGLVVFLVTLALTIPASQAYRLLEGELPLDAMELQGNLLEGGADTLVVEGIRIDQVRWRLDTSALRSAQVVYHVSGQVADGQFSGRVSPGTDGRVTLSDVRAEVGADALVRLVGETHYPATLGGRVDATIRDAELHRGQPVRLDGVVNWSGASVSALGETVALGSFGARAETTAGGGLRSDLRNTEPGPLDVDGMIELALDGTMTGTTRVTTTDAASEELLQGMMALGIPDPTETLDIRFEGNINDPMGFHGRLQ